MFLFNASRVRLLMHLPKGGIVAEIGVARGGFAKHIVRLTQPDLLYLIDPWERFSAHLAGMGSGVVDLFHEQIGAGRVVVLPLFSREIEPYMVNGMLSWAYIDAAHDEANALADLRAFGPKIAPDGFLLGHDFSDNPITRGRGFGVVEAVRQFMTEDNWRMVAITQETAPSFLLTRAGNTTTLPVLTDQLRHLGSDRAVELPDSALDHFTQVADTREPGRPIYVVRFDARPVSQSVA